MSIYATVVSFDDEDAAVDPDAGRSSLKYIHSGWLPTEDDARAGRLDIALIPGWVYRDDRPAVDENGEKHWPWLRLSVDAEDDHRGVDVVLDRDHALALHAFLETWLRQTGDGTIPEAGE